MPINKTDKSTRILQSRRYTIATNDSQEAFTRVLDLNASEIYIDQNLIPTSNIPFSGSSQSGSIFVSASKNILKYYHNHNLSKSSIPSGSFTETWFFLDPTSSIPVPPGIIQSSQQINFISNKYANPSLADNNAETAGSNTAYNVVVRINGAEQSINNYAFDYKMGVLQFYNNPPLTTDTVTITAYQYLGDTLNQFISSSGGGTGAGFPFSGSAVITGSLTVSGSSGITLVGGGTLIGTASWATNVTSASYATNAQNVLPTLFEIPELGITGSGIVISSSTALPANTYNSIRIGNSELIDDYSSYFMFSVAGNSGWAFSSSINGTIATLQQNNFNFLETSSNTNFRSNATDFTVYKSQSASNDATTAFNVNRQTGLLYSSGGASISGSVNIQNTLNVGSTIISPTITSINDSITSLTNATSSYVTNAQTSSFLLATQTGSLASLGVTGDAVIQGDLTVNGTTTYINVDNLLVEDKFILLNSGSKGGVPNEGGIIIQTSASVDDDVPTAYGTALFYDQTANRWLVAKSSSVAFNTTNIVIGTTTDYIVTAYVSASAPTGTPVNFGTGNSNYSVGQMYIQTDTSDIYIYA
jgi:hypothetical protein